MKRLVLPQEIEREWVFLCCLVMAVGISARNGRTIPVPIQPPLTRAVAHLYRETSHEQEPTFRLNKNADLATPVRPETNSRGKTASHPVRTGLDYLVADEFRILRGRRVGVICNQTAVDSRRRHIVDLMVASGNVRIVALFSPEHGIRGNRDESVGDTVDSKTGLPVYSLYNPNLPAAQRYRPTTRMLRGIDTLVFDIQDIGVRYYTYISTLGHVLEEAGRRHIPILILDRPNPLGGLNVDGPNLQPDLFSFAGYHPMPITHGMTIGELAQLFNAERNLGASIQVVPLQNWRRDMLFSDTGLPWVNPSPNIRSLNEAILYSGIGFLEDLPLSVGRGTHHPFELVGAPWIKGPLLARWLNACKLPGLSFQAAQFIPNSDEWEGKRCSGVHISVTSRRRLDGPRLGIYLAEGLAHLYPGVMNASRLNRMDVMVGNRTIPRAIACGAPPQPVINSWAGDVASWRRRRAPFLLY